MKKEIEWARDAEMKSKPKGTAAAVIEPQARPTHNWEDIEIRFLSDDRVQIFINGKPTETRNYAELVGFVDARNGRPNQAWATLRALAERSGIQPVKGPGLDRTKVEKRMQEIRKALRNHFGISADPLSFIAGIGYQARFKITCTRSFNTGRQQHLCENLL